MASRQEQRAESVEGSAQAERAGEHIARAEAHAREAAREIAHERTERARVVGAGEHEEDKESTQRRRGGILETVQQGARSLVSAVGRTLGVATKDNKASQAADATAHKAGETRGKVGEHKDLAADKSLGAKDTAAQSAGEAAEATRGKVGEYKDCSADRATGLKDAAAHKAGEAAETARDKTAAVKDATAHKAADVEAGNNSKDSAVQASKEDAAASKAKQSTEGFSNKAASDAMEEDTARSPEEKLEEYKQSAADAARRAMEYLTLRTEQQSKASVDATEEVVRQEVDATRQRTEQVADAERRWKEAK